MQFLLRNSLMTVGVAMPLLVIACEAGSITEAGDPSMRTLDRYYQFRPIGHERSRVEIPWVYTNHTSDTIYVVGCKGDVAPNVEKLVDGEWVLIWGPIHLLCMGSVEIAPGATLEDTLRIEHHPDSRFPMGALPGTFRLAWGDTQAVHHFDSSLRGSRWGDPLPLARRVSNSFTLRGPEPWPGGWAPTATSPD